VQDGPHESRLGSARGITQGAAGHLSVSWHHRVDGAVNFPAEGHPHGREPSWPARKRVSDAVRRTAALDRRVRQGADGAPSRRDWHAWLLNNADADRDRGVIGGLPNVQDAGWKISMGHWGPGALASFWSPVSRVVFMASASAT
jgi:hypothetical protein